MERYARVLNDRVKLMTADKVMDEQGGFREGVEKTIEKDSSVYIAFVDLEKAYYNANRRKLWKMLEE